MAQWASPIRGVNRPGRVGLSRKIEPTRSVRVEKILSRDTLLNLQTRNLSGDLG